MHTNNIFKSFSFVVIVVWACGVVLKAQDGSGERGQSTDLPKAKSTLMQVVQKATPPQGPIEPMSVPKLYEISREEIVRLGKIESPPPEKGAELPPDAPQPEEDGSGKLIETMAPTIGTSFNGQSQNGWRPADATIAVGNNHIVVATNEQWSIYDKSGTLLYSSSLQSWHGYSSSTNIYDPKVIYDPWNDRFVMLALRRTSSPNYYMISVSQTSSAIGWWWIYELNASKDGNTSTNNWADFPGLGFNMDCIFITTNQYNNSDNFQYAKLRILKKSQLYAGASVSWYDFWAWNNCGGGNLFTWKPAHMWSAPSGDPEYLVNTKSGGWDKVTIYKVTNCDASEPSLTRVCCPNVGDYDVPPAFGTGNAKLRDTLDCRTQEVFYQQGRLSTAFTEKYNWGSGSVASVRYLRINTDCSVNRNKIYGADGKQYYYPNVYEDWRCGTGTCGSATSYGNMHMVFSRSSSSENPSIRVTGQKVGAGSIESSAQLKAGNASNTSGRWGDYSGICLDNASRYRVWAYSMWAESGNIWKTRVGRLNYATSKVVAQDSYPEESVNGVAERVPPMPTTRVASRVGDELVVLDQNYPNVFNPFTTINYILFEDSPVKLSVYNMLGQEVKRLVETEQEGGTYTVIWDGTDNFGTPVSSGVYLYRLIAGSQSETRKMTLMR